MSYRTEPWRLVSINARHYSQWDDDICATFHRSVTTASGRRSWVETCTIIVESDGVTKFFKGARRVGMKQHLRERRHRLCCQAVAYAQLNGGEVDGFPEQVEI